MQRYSPDGIRSMDAVSGPKGQGAGFRARMVAALCLDQEAGAGRRQQEAGSPEEGSAVVEFTFLALLLMVPLVYFIITIGQIQGGSFAVVGAADQAAKVYVAQPDLSSARAAAEQAAAIALADFGHRPDEASIATACNPADCLAPGTAVTVTVRLTVPLPFVPFNDGFALAASDVEASATQLVGRFR